MNTFTWFKRLFAKKPERLGEFKVAEFPIVSLRSCEDAKMLQNSIGSDLYYQRLAVTRDIRNDDTIETLGLVALASAIGDSVDSSSYLSDSGSSDWSGGGGDFDGGGASSDW